MFMAYLQIVVLDHAVPAQTFYVRSQRWDQSPCRLSNVEVSRPGMSRHFLTRRNTNNLGDRLTLQRWECLKSHPTFNVRSVSIKPMRRPVIRAFTSVVVLFTLIFCQLWISAYACTTTGRPDSSGTSVSMIATSYHGDLRDHHTGLACHVHCDDSAQPSHAEQPAPSPLAWLPLIWGYSAIPALAIQPHFTARPKPILISAPPPPRILFQVFRT
jgi:hypothetical protein